MLQSLDEIRTGSVRDHTAHFLLLFLRQKAGLADNNLQVSAAAGSLMVSGLISSRPGRVMSRLYKADVDDHINF